MRELPLYTIDAMMGTTKLPPAYNGGVEFRSANPRQDARWVHLEEGDALILEGKHKGKPISTKATHWRLTDQSGRIIATASNPHRKVPIHDADSKYAA